MSTRTTTPRNTSFAIGWIALLALSALASLNHIVLIFAFADEASQMVGWAGFTLYSTVVLYLPFRRGERWAWYTSWILAIGFAGLIFFDRAIGPYYLGGAVLMASALLLTRPSFFQRVS